MDETEAVHSVNVPIEWYIPDDIQSIYASNVFIQPGEYEITLSFFETLLPILAGSPEENKARIERIEAIKAKCVARVVIHPDLIPRLIQALQNGLDGYIATKRLLEEEGSK